MRISFLGAAGTVTGSQIFLSHQGFGVLVDCGSYQGPKALRLLNWEKPVHFNEVKAMVITHAHIDHCGLIPRWIRLGWRGPIFCTRATRNLLAVMLLDAAKLQVEDAAFANRTQYSHHNPALPLYDEQDALEALKHLFQVPYNEWHHLVGSQKKDGFSFCFKPAGHILGSASVQFAFTDGQISRLLSFSGDLGGQNSNLLEAPESFLETDFLVMESTYGDRPSDLSASQAMHPEGEGISSREQQLREVITTVFERGGTLVIPAFALGRTQDLLFSLYQLRIKKLIPSVPVYLDSPMASKVTQIYLDHIQELKMEAVDKDLHISLSDQFFRPVESSDESMLLCMSNEPKIVISASGMLQGGRVMHHLKSVLPKPENGVLFVGYQASETKGRLLRDGIRSLRIHHKEVPVEAEIFSTDGFSAHANADELVAYAKNFSRGPQKVFLNHGEESALMMLSSRLRKEIEAEVVVPKMGEAFNL